MRLPPATWDSLILHAGLLALNSLYHAMMTFQVDLTRVDNSAEEFYVVAIDFRLLV